VVPENWGRDLAAVSFVLLFTQNWGKNREKQDGKEKVQSHV